MIPKLSSKGWAAINHLNRSEKHYIAVGATGSGKTKSQCAAFAFAIVTHPRAGRYTSAIVSASQSTALDILVRPHLGVQWWLRYFGFESRVKIEQSSPVLLVQLGNGDVHRVLLVGSTNETAERKVRGQDFLYGLIDEITLMKEPFVDLLFTRFRAEILVGNDRYNSKTWVSTNTDVPDHFFKVNYIDNPGFNSICHNVYIEDNPICTQQYIDETIGHLSGTAYQRFRLCRWVAHTGLIFPIWSYGDFMGVPESWSLGFDWATGRGVVATTLYAHYPGRVLSWRDNKFDGMTMGELTTEGHKDRILVWLQELEREEGLDIGLPKYCIGDPSTDPRFKDHLRRAGIPWIDGKNDVIEGINHTRNLLGEKAYQIDRGCVNTIKSLNNYRWKEGALNDNPLKDGFDHFADVLRYHAFTPRQTVTVSRPWY